MADLTPSPGELFIPKPRKHIELAELLARVTPENTPDEVDWGRAEGQEEW